MKTILIIIMLFMAVPCLAATGNVAHSKADRKFLCEIMSMQARMGVVINGIASNWRLRGQEFVDLGEYGPRLAEATEEICGRLPEPVMVEASDFTEKRGKLLREAAEILGEADSLALELYEMGEIEPDKVALLEDANENILGILGGIAE